MELFKKDKYGLQRIYYLPNLNTKTDGILFTDNSLSINVFNIIISCKKLL